MRKTIRSDFLKRAFATSPLQMKTYLNINEPGDPKNANIELSIDQNHTCTGNVTISGILPSPQISPIPYQFKFNTIKAPGLCHYNGTTLLNPPSSSQNFRTIEIGRGDRYSQIALPWDADKMFFRWHQDNNFTPWM